MDDVLDQPLIQPDQTRIKYGGFWKRFGALIIDGIILAPISVGVSYLNLTSWKSPMILIAITLIGIGYKPFMELMYGATLGKMAVKLKVTNLEFGTATAVEILLRNIFHIVPSLITLILTVGMYTDPEFESVSGFGDFTNFSRSYPGAKYINYAIGLITIIEAIMLISDNKKRTLHDRIGGTFVIESR